MPTNKKVKVDWPSWIGASIVVGGALCAIGGFLFNQRVLPKEREYEARFLRDEKKCEDKFVKLESKIKEIEETIEEKDEKREMENKKQTALLHSIDIQLVKFNLGFEMMKEDIKELKDKIK